MQSNREPKQWWIVVGSVVYFLLWNRNIRVININARHNNVSLPRSWSISNFVKLCDWSRNEKVWQINLEILVVSCLYEAWIQDSAVTLPFRWAQDSRGTKEAQRIQQKRTSKLAAKRQMSTKRSYNTLRHSPDRTPAHRHDIPSSNLEKQIKHIGLLRSSVL